MKTHAPSQTEVEVTKVKSRIKRKATTTLETPQQILGTELRNTSEWAAASLPGVSTLRRNARKARKNFDTPPNPVTREETPEIPEQYQLNVSGQQFMIFDSGIADHQKNVHFYFRTWPPMFSRIRTLVCRWYLESHPWVSLPAIHHLWTITGKHFSLCFWIVAE